MASGILVRTFFIFGILTILSACHQTTPKTNQINTELILVNPYDSLEISKIVKIRKDGYREIYATGPEAMRYIFYRSGCKDGSPLSGLLHHEWNDSTHSARWTGACKSMKTDSIYFRLIDTKNPAILKQFGEFTLNYLQLAEEKKDISYFLKAIETEPALPDARLNLFYHELKQKNCNNAKRHLNIFLSLSPGFPGNPSLKKSYQTTCEK